MSFSMGRQESKFKIEKTLFEIKVEMSRGKKRGWIMETEGGYSSWIRMGYKSMGLLLIEIEENYQDLKGRRTQAAWLEDGRSFRIDKIKWRGAFSDVFSQKC